MDPEKKKLNFIFPTKYVIPKSLKFSHWPSKFMRCQENSQICVKPGKFHRIMGASVINYTNLKWRIGSVFIEVINSTNIISHSKKKGAENSRIHSALKKCHAKRIVIIQPPSCLVRHFRRDLWVKNI